MLLAIQLQGGMLRAWRKMELPVRGTQQPLE